MSIPGFHVNDLIDEINNLNDLGDIDSNTLLDDVNNILNDSILVNVNSETLQIIIYNAGCLRNFTETSLFL